VEPILAIVPAYNEEKTVAEVVRGVLRVLPRARVLVVDDGSADATAGLARRAGAAVVSHPFNLGYGAALETGFLYALSHGFSAAVLVDGDGQHDPAFLPRLLEPLASGRADLVVGSRFLERGGYRTPRMRRAGMLLFGWLASLYTGQRVTDPTSGFQALNRRAMELFAAGHFPPDFPDADVLILLSRAGLVIREVPVRMNPAPDAGSMHRGLVPLYYVFKMLLSMALAMVRKKPGGFAR